MKCPVCNAKLLPVNRELFCLQCGEVVRKKPAADDDSLTLEETTDPMLQRAIRDAGNEAAKFKAVVPAKSFASLPVRLAPAKPAARKSLWLDMVGAGPRGTGAATAVALLPALPERRRKTHSRAGRGSHWLSLGVALAVGVAALAALNMATGAYYEARVYPGVKLGSVAVGDWTYAELNSKLPALVQPPPLKAVVEGREYELNLAGAAKVDVEELEARVQESGRGAWPLLGVVKSYTQPPIEADYVLNAAEVTAAVKRLAAQVERTPVSAVPMTVGRNVFVIADKPGLGIDEAETERRVREAFGHSTSVTIEAKKLTAQVVATDYAPNVTAAEAMIAAVPQLVTATGVVSPSPEQIAAWLVFGRPGEAPVVDVASAGEYVASLPGSFDRATAVSRLVAALNAHTSERIAVPATPATAVPAHQKTLPAWPLVSYTYCVLNTGQSGRELSAVAGSVLGAGGSWTLGGRVKYVLGSENCNFVARIADRQAMAGVNEACALQTSCRIHNDVAISALAWTTKPPKWPNELADYRVELVNHVVGQWLGFEHAACGNTGEKPVLNAPHLTVSGCSPEWYPVPASLQDTKVLPGF